jgi:hypothetical protein
MGLTRTLLVVGAGAALAYFLDPASGKDRRQRVRDYWDERTKGTPADPLVVEPEPSPTIVVKKDAPPRAGK